MIRYARIGALALAMLAALVFFAACKSDKKNNNEPTATTAAGTTPTGGSTPSGSTTPSDASSELSTLVSQAEQREVKVAYDFSGGGTDGTLTLYSKPPNLSRVDFGSADGDFIIITNADGTYLCTTGSCIASPAGSAGSPVPFLDIFTSPQALESLVSQSLGNVDVNRSSETVAGEDATCFSASGTASGESGSGTFCFAQDGILVRLSASSSGGDFSLEATSVERTVSDSDFELPYDVTDIGSP